MRLSIVFILACFLFLSSVSLHAADSHYIVKLEISSEEAAILEVAEATGPYVAPRADLSHGADFRYEIISAGRIAAAGYFRDPRRLSALFDEKLVVPGQAHYYNGMLESGVALLRIPALNDAVLRLYSAEIKGQGYRAIQDLSLSAAPFVSAASTKATGDVEVIEENGPSGNRLNIVILGDGYTADQQNDLYDDAVWLTDEFTAIEPWKEYREYFNFHLVHVVSNESGADHPSQGVYVDTALDAQYDYAGLERLLVVNNFTVQNIVQNAFPDFLENPTYVFVLVNDEAYGGSGGEVAVTSLNEYAPEVLLHEAGHMIGNLADEYDDPWPEFVPSGEEANVTEEDDPAKIKWRIWIEEGTPLPTPEDYAYADLVGLFEGARYQASGIYRPKLDCRMKILGVDYCEVCTEALLESMYVEVMPSDAVGGEVYLYEGETITLNAEPLQTAGDSIKVRWSVDSAPLESSDTDELEFNADEMSEGAHSVEALVYDDSELMRREEVLELARMTLEWTLIVEGGPNPDGDSDNSADGDTDMENPSDGDAEIPEQAEEIIEDGDSYNPADGDAPAQSDGDEEIVEEVEFGSGSQGCAAADPSWFILLLLLGLTRRHSWSVQ